MMNPNFRLLKADEIELRPATITAKGLSMLCYKDARVDQRILDESVGPMNWQRHHTRDNANCVVSIWDEDKKQWIEKEDTGTESNTEKEKGLASDSFKRACFNWGIGRELYTAPFIWIPAGECNVSEKNGRYTTNDRFHVTEIEYEDGKISYLVIANSKTKKTVYTFGRPAKSKAGVNTNKASDNEQPKTTPAENARVKILKDELLRTGTGEASMLQFYNMKTLEELANSGKYVEALNKLKARPAKK